jgi:hypothetical protein
VAPCDANFNCVSATVANSGQVVKITAHLAFAAGSAAPTGALCILAGGAPANCGLSIGSDESWFTSFTSSQSLKATYAGDANYAASSSAAIGLTIGSAPPPPVASITVTPANQTCAPGASIQFAATDQTGADVTSSAAWSSSNPSIAPISAGGKVGPCGSPSADTAVTISATK